MLGTALGVLPQATALGVLLQGDLPWYWRWALRIQLRFDTVGEQVLATVLVFLLFAALSAAIRYVGSRFAERFRPETIDALVWGLITTLSVVLGGFLVAVWRLTSDVEAALGSLLFGPQEAIRLLVTLIAIISAYSLTRLGRRWIESDRIGKTFTAQQRAIAAHVVQFVMVIPVVLFVVRLWEVPVGSLFLGAGALGIVIGFAARKTLSDTLSGIIILIARPFEVNDWIEVGDNEGLVTEVTLQSTKIRTFNEEHVLVPNDRVTSEEIVNYTQTERLRVEVDVGVDYDVDVRTAAEVATAAMESCETVADSPQPDVIRQGFGDSSVLLRLRFWITNPTMQRKLAARNEVIDAVKAAFESEGITIPFPQRVLTQRAESPELQVTLDSDGDAVAGRGDDGADADAATDGAERRSEESHDGEEPGEATNGTGPEREGSHD